MSERSSINRRAFMRTAFGVGGTVAAAGAITSSLSIRDAYAQMLKSGISEDSALAKMKKTGKLKVGFAQTKPNFYLDVKTNKLRGIFYDTTQWLGKETETEIEYQEVNWVNATVSLRKGDYDVFVSSLTHTIPRALVINYVGPIHHKGFIAVIHKDNADRFKTPDDLNKEDVVFAANLGTSIANQVKLRFPKAKIMEVPGQLALTAEPVRTKQAHAMVDGDFDMEVFVGNNKWAHLVEPENPFQLLPNTWAIRYGDPEWKFFLDMFANRMRSSGFMAERFAAYRNELIG